MHLSRCDVRGPHQLLQKRSLTLVSILQRLAATEIASALHLRDFRRPVIFEFFNTIRQQRSFAFEAEGGEPHHGSSPLLRSSQEQRKSSNPLPKSTASLTGIFAVRTGSRTPSICFGRWVLGSGRFAGVFRNRRLTLVQSRHPQTTPFP